MGCVLSGQPLILLNDISVSKMTVTPKQYHGLVDDYQRQDLPLYWQRYLPQHK